jgi:hypothetical protein
MGGGGYLSVYRIEMFLVEPLEYLQWLGRL